jgi:cardiolipin synthase A/B
MPFLLAADGQEIAGWITLSVLIIDSVCLMSILHLKRDPQSALAWCFTVLALPFVGAVLFALFGYQNIDRPIKRKRRHAADYRLRLSNRGDQSVPSSQGEEIEGWNRIAQLAHRLGADRLTFGNRVEQYHEVAQAYEVMLKDMESAKHHIHLQMFIFRSDATGQRFIEILAKKAKEGVQVRLLYDAVGCWNLRRSLVQLLTDVGGKVASFLPISLLRRRIQINLRNHRKLLVIDGKIGYTGGLNIGDEYLGKSTFFGSWRDSAVRIEGWAVHSFQRLFNEDWNFATNEDIRGSAFFPKIETNGDVSVQVAWSGPDQELKTIREVLFAVIMRAKQRVWIASPYFVPDAGLLDALCLAARSGLDVRLLCPFRPDKWLPFLAARYYWQFVIPAGVKVYQYTAGFLHAKNILVDDQWCSIGTANFDNRSLFLNFEVNCFLDSVDQAKKLEESFLHDFAQSIRIDLKEFSKRPVVGRLAENACRLFSPVLYPMN